MAERVIVGAFLSGSAASGVAAAQNGGHPHVSPTPSADPWSTLSEGVRARLVITAVHDATGHAQVQVDLEVENVSSPQGTVMVSTDLARTIEFAVEDESGAPVPALHPGGNEMAPVPTERPLARGASARFVVSTGALEYVPDGRTLFRPRTFQAWVVTPMRTGRVYVRAALPAVNLERTDPHAWPHVTVALPRVVLP